MSAINPNSVAVETSLRLIETQVADALSAPGQPGVNARMTLAIMQAALRAFAVEKDSGNTLKSILIGTQISFSAAISSLVLSSVNGDPKAAHGLGKLMTDMIQLMVSDSTKSFDRSDPKTTGVNISAVGRA